MHIQHKQTGNRGVFFVQPEGEEILAELTYLQHDDQLVIDHTEVDQELQGQNVGYQLVNTAVEYARTHHFKVVPVCQFAAAVFGKKPEYGDVWQKEE